MDERALARPVRQARVAGDGHSKFEIVNLQGPLVAYHIAPGGTAEIGRGDQQPALAVRAEFIDFAVAPSRVCRLVLLAKRAAPLAVDVEAMASACALHTGELALNQGYVGIARDLFVSIITLHSGENSYYVLKAKTLLARLEQGINVSFNAR